MQVYKHTPSPKSHIPRMKTCLCPLVARIRWMRTVLTQRVSATLHNVHVPNSTAFEAQRAK